jgi:hypothetical protein
MEIKLIYSASESTFSVESVYLFIYSVDTNNKVAPLRRAHHSLFKQFDGVKANKIVREILLQCSWRLLVPYDPVSYAKFRICFRFPLKQTKTSCGHIQNVRIT